MLRIGRPISASGGGLATSAFTFVPSRFPRVEGSARIVAGRYFATDGGPKCNEKLSSQCCDHCLAEPPPATLNALMGPATEGGSWLMAQPQPCQLDHGCPQPVVSGIWRSPVRGRSSRFARFCRWSKLSIRSAMMRWYRRLASRLRA